MAADIPIFISYAHEDGAELAKSLLRDLKEKGFHAWLDTSRLVGGTSWAAEVEQAIDESQVVLALLTNGSYRSDVCRAEQLRALRKCKRVIPVLAQRGTEIPLHLEAKQYRDLTDRAARRAQVDMLIADIREGKGGIQLKEEFRHTYVTAPPLPRNYVDRPQALSKLRAALISDGSGVSIALKPEQIVVETKMTRKGLGQKEVVTELAEDILRYQSHQDCKTLICFVYDPAGRCSHPTALEHDLSKDHGTLRIIVIVQPKRY